MIPGDIVKIRDKHGHVYEAVIRGQEAGSLWRFEWLTGPNDTKEDVAVFNQGDQPWTEQ